MKLLGYILPRPIAGLICGSLQKWCIFLFRNRCFYTYGFSFILVVFLSSKGFSQPSDGYSGESLQVDKRSYRERGIPYIQNFNPIDNRDGAESLAIVQGANGLIYVANQQRILEYDGVSWRFISIPEDTEIEALASGPDGKIYVGGSDDIGYLAPDSLGQLQFVSLKDELDPKFRDFKDVENIHVLNDAVFFQFDKQLMRWKNGVFTIWRSQTGYGLAGVINNELFIYEYNTGLRKFTGESLKTIFEKQQSAAGPYALFCCDIAPYKKGQILYLTARRGCSYCMIIHLNPSKAPPRPICQKI